MINKAPKGRTTRTPVSKRNILTVKGKDPAYHYRIVNDADGRVDVFEAAGYEICKNEDVQVGDKRVSAATAEGSLAQISVGKGTKAFVMRQKKEWYEEDQLAKEAHLRSVESTMEKVEGKYGEINIRSTDKPSVNY